LDFFSKSLKYKKIKSNKQEFFTLTLIFIQNYSLYANFIPSTTRFGNQEALIFHLHHLWHSIAALQGLTL